MKILIMLIITVLSMPLLAQAKRYAPEFKPKNVEEHSEKLAVKPRTEKQIATAERAEWIKFWIKKFLSSKKGDGATDVQIIEHLRAKNVVLRDIGILIYVRQVIAEWDSIKRPKTEFKEISIAK